MVERDRFGVMRRQILLDAPDKPMFSTKWLKDKAIIGMATVPAGEHCATRRPDAVTAGITSSSRAWFKPT